MACGVFQDVWIIDTGPLVMLLVGTGTSLREKVNAMHTATRYLKGRGKLHTTPIEVFKSIPAAMCGIFDVVLGTSLTHLDSSQYHPARAARCTLRGAHACRMLTSSVTATRCCARFSHLQASHRTHSMLS